MNYGEDYYAVLQVHYMAEPEIIESAYKRLARKYHPDVNKNAAAEMIMKRINLAYEVLKDPDRRKGYHREWVKKHGRQKPHSTGMKPGAGNEQYAAPAKAVLTRYFDSLLNQRFALAYDLITDNDKEHIPRHDFIRWQSTVAKIYRLQRFDCSLSGMTRNIQSLGRKYGEAVDLFIIVAEYNVVMDRLENDYLVKTVVLDDKGWRVLLGYGGLKPLIARFEGLTELIAVRSVIDELAETRSRLDPLTGLCNKKGFLELAAREAYRYSRYKRAFSLAVCEIGANEIIDGGRGRVAQEAAVKWMGNILQDNLRELDIIGRWGDRTFIILLCETELKAAIKAVRKIRTLFAGLKFVYYQASYETKLAFGIVEYSAQAMEVLIKKAVNYASIGGKLENNRIVSREGIE